VLSDPEKRKAYDSTGNENYDSSGSHSHQKSDFNYNEFFKDFDEAMKDHHARHKANHDKAHADHMKRHHEQVRRAQAGNFNFDNLFDDFFGIGDDAFFGSHGHDLNTFGDGESYFKEGEFIRLSKMIEMIIIFKVSFMF
jgi:DnaJ-class molecular chaperone